MNGLFSRLVASFFARFVKPPVQVNNVKHDHSQFERVKFVNSED